MATNWLKDGLDAYLALTGERRAERKAEAELESQRINQELAINADRRATAAAGLHSEISRQQIAKGKREEEDAAKWDNLLFEESYKKEFANPQTVTAATINDPEQVKASKYIYSNNLKTVGFARQAVAEKGGMTIPLAEMSKFAPDYAQQTVTQIFGPAAKKREGQLSVDPVTGKTGIITGNMGHVNLEKGPDGEVYLSADMEVKNEDGTIRYAPFTNRTDDPNQPVKRVPLKAIEYEANAVIQGTDDALTTGIDPSVAITARKLRGMESWPLELKKKFYLNMLEEDKNLRTRASDVAITQKVGKTLEGMQGEIDALPWKQDPHGSAARLFTTLSQTGMTTAEVDKALKIVVSSKTPADKSLKTVEIGAGGDNVTQAIVSPDGTITPIGKPYPKHAKSIPGESKVDNITRRDIAVRLRDARRAYDVARKQNNPDGMVDAIDQMEALNEDAKQYGVVQQRIPSRPLTSEEEQSLRSQAIDNLKSQRGAVGRFFNTSPSAKEVEAEAQRLKTSQKPTGSRPAGVTSTGRFNFPQTTSKAQSAAGNGFPPAAEHAGKTGTDTVTGKRYRSNGVAWIEVR